MHSDESEQILDYRCLLFGTALLAIGALFYATARPATMLSFLPHAPGALHYTDRALQGLAGSVPTFIHTVAFSALCASVIGLSFERLIVVCMSWAAIESIFEVAQHPRLLHWLSTHSSVVSSVSSVQGGTFDLRDILAALFGAATSVFVLTAIRRRTQ